MRDAMSKSKFSIKNLLFLILIVALGIGWFVSSRELASTSHELKTLRKEYHFLDVRDPGNIAAVALPETHSNRLWQWRVHIPPDEGHYTLGVACFDLLVDQPPNRLFHSMHLEPGESIVSMSIEKQDGKWVLKLAQSKKEGGTTSRDRELIFDSTQWIDKEDMYYGDHAGHAGTDEVGADETLVLLHVISPEPGMTKESLKEPRDGIKLWIKRYEAPD